MACNVYVNQKLALECSVSAFQTIYEIFDKYADLNGFYSNVDFKNFMFEMFTAVESRCSYGFDFADYIKTQHAIDLLLKTIDGALPELKEILIERVVLDVIRLKNDLSLYQDVLDKQVVS